MGTSHQTSQIIILAAQYLRCMPSNLTQIINSSTKIGQENSVKTKYQSYIKLSNNNLRLRSLMSRMENRGHILIINYFLCNMIYFSTTDRILNPGRDRIETNRTIRMLLILDFSYRQELHW